MTREERKKRDEDFKRRLQPRLLWDSSQGTAVISGLGYEAKPPVKKRVRRLTDAQYNAEGRAIRRRQHRAARGFLPYAKR